MRKQSYIKGLTTFIAGIALCAFSGTTLAGSAEKWEVKNAGRGVNTEYHEGWSVMTSDGLTLMFASNRPGGLSETNIEDHWAMAKAGGATQYDIYVSHRSSTEKSWQTPVRLPETVNSVASDHSASLSEDGHYLLFASDRTGTCGELDLYASYRKDAKDDFGWEAAVHLGCSDANGTGHDSCPILRGDQLYFTSSVTPDPMTLDFKKAHFDRKTMTMSQVQVLKSSTPFMDAHFDPDHGYVWAGYPKGGLGGSDIWRFSERDGTPNSFAKPVNLGAPINTASEEQMPSTTKDGKVMNFVSDRPGGFGGLDIWQANSAAK